MDLTSLLQSTMNQVIALAGGITAFLTFLIIFREQLAQLLSRLPEPYAQLLSKIPLVKIAMGKHAFQIEFGEQIKNAKARAKGIEETVAASRAMLAPNLLRDPGRQAARDIVLAAWGALQQIVYDACTASKMPLTPATRIPEAVRRLGDGNVITAEIAYLLNVLYRLGQELSGDTELRPLEDDARRYKELADLVVDWMMLSVLYSGDVDGSKRGEELTSRRKTMVGGHFPQPWSGYPAVLLVGVGGPVQGQRFSVDKQHYRIGSNADNDLRIIGDGYVSGTHASLRYEKGSLFLYDQGSRNGSFLNGKQVIRTPVMVKQGDQIRLGDSVFQVTGPQT